MAASAGIDAAGLPDLAVARPSEAMRQSALVLRGNPDARAASYAHQAVGIVQRDAGHLSAALRTLAAARTQAQLCGDTNRVADVCASLGAAQVLHGRPDAGLRTFADAVAAARGPSRARVRVRLGIVLGILGRDGPAIAVLTAAIASCRRTAQPQWEARARLARCMSHLAQGATRAADNDAVRAEALFAAGDFGLEAAKAVHNRGLVAYAAGRLPDALEYFALAEQGYRQSGVDVLGLAEERCAVLIDVGLAADALTEAEAALQRPAPAAVRSQLQLASAAAALEIGRPRLAAQRAAQAERGFHVQSRPSWAGQARLVRIAADAAIGRSTRRPRRALTDLSGLSAGQARSGRLLAGVFLLGSDPRAARTHLDLVAAAPARTALQRAGRQLARAHLAALDGRLATALRACNAGLAAVAEHQLAFAAPEMQALAGYSGRQLTDLALRTALDTGVPRTLLLTAERTRLTSAVDAPASNPRLAQTLAALREVNRRTAAADGAALTSLHRERANLERAVRHQQRVLKSTNPARLTIDAAALTAALGPRHLVELVIVGADLHALVIVRGRVSRQRVGPLDAAATEIAHARAALRRAVYGRGVDLAAVGERLQRALLGATAALRLGDAPVVIVPPGLAMAPWALLPALRTADFTVAASATQWLAAANSPAPRSARAVFVAGPGVGDADADLAAFTRWHPRGQVLRGADATTERVLAALDGARLAHIAAHGTFRTDNPLFSTLRMADGPLSGYDLQRLHRAPHRVVLAACHGAATSEDAGLGIIAVLTTRGAAGVIAPVVEVADDPAAEVSRLIHECLAQGLSLSAAGRAARTTTAGTPTAVAACAYLAVGA